MSGAIMTNTFAQALLELDDYVTGHQDDVAAAAYEEALFARALAGDAQELGFRAGLSGTLKAMKARGTINLWLTSAQLGEVHGVGLKVAFFELDLVNPKAPVIPEDADLFITKIPLDLNGVRRLEAEVVADDGRTLKRMLDIRFDPRDNAIFACCEAELARTANNAHRTTRLWATNEAGHRQLLIELPGL